jgi:catechol 2,3-dioxygenase-like lactoylglutathione lyase family enzyme
MLSHVMIGVEDMARATDFYEGLMALLDHRVRFRQDDMIVWQPANGERPYFAICRPYDGRAASPGNGQMVAFSASRDLVNRAYDYALAHGGRDEGAPGLRPDYHPNYYGAYFRDPDGNKLCVVCHAAES